LWAFVSMRGTDGAHWLQSGTPSRSASELAT
jgi:hypothetical protein